MIKIQCAEPDDERWRKWKNQCAREQAKANERVARGESANIAARVYKGQTYDVRNWFFFAKVAPFFGKCAYCEVNLFVSQHGDVEHYRPKDAVADADNQVVLVVIDGKSTPHPGYYWLAYDWHNLVPSCSLCNTLNHRSEGSRLIGKGTRFPVSGEYAIAPGEEAQEQPLLLLPTVDDPGNHIEMTETGVVNWKTERGKATIDILGLNERGLPDERRRVYNDTKLRLATLIHAVALDDTRTRDALQAEFRKIKTGVVEYAAVARRALRDRLSTIRPQLQELDQE